ncbi:unnamed protein product [Darwinula stevensoni]|uniref:S phase cyclin A-associated protein in the endoplasmic reticulum n=1 Tax=Darwinula stevensoni TaxID=69355 RepID=A0A7R9FNJ7_9CRUS|nr:unnamed protein product [Darwinula stevensoni]CAG0896893.1 unnamed protein product [Darwinula stevensoni]
MEDVRFYVTDEGKSSTIAFSVPATDDNHGKGLKPSDGAKSPPLTPVTEDPSHRGHAADKGENKESHGAPKELLRLSKRDSPPSSSRVRSASTGRGKNDDLRARYWALLFENLRRAVDEIYQTCEKDESILECKETILMLENYTRDFHSLIDWLKLKWEYENTPPRQRPTSFAWEIRKTTSNKYRVETRPGEPEKAAPFCSLRRYINFTLKSASVQTEDEMDEGANETPILPFSLEIPIPKSSIESQTSPISPAPDKSTFNEVDLTQDQFVQTDDIGEEELSHLVCASAEDESVDETQLSENQTEEKSVGENSNPLYLQPCLEIKQVIDEKTEDKTKLSLGKPKSPIPELAASNEGSTIMVQSVQLKPQIPTNRAWLLRSMAIRSGNVGKGGWWGTPVRGPSAPNTPIVRPRITLQSQAPLRSNLSIGCMRRGGARGKAVMGNTRPTNPSRLCGSTSSISSSCSSSTSSTGQGRRKIIDEDGWEMVQGRSRSKHIQRSQARNAGSGDVSRSTENVQQASRSNVSPGLGHKGVSSKWRMHIPSSAMSLPSVVIIDQDTSHVSPSHSQRPSPKEQFSEEKDKEGRKEEEEEDEEEEEVDTSSQGQQTKTAGRGSGYGSSKKDLTTKAYRDATKQQQKGNGTEKGRNPERKKSDPSSRKLNEEVCPKDATTDLELRNEVKSVRETMELTDFPLEDQGKKDEVEEDEEDRKQYQEMKACDAAIESALQEEQNLQKEIFETEKQDIQMLDAEEEVGDLESKESQDHRSLEEEYDSILSGMSWGDQMDFLEEIAREPGRAMQMHEKLSTQVRKRTSEETLKRHEEKQAKAQELREKLLEQKANKLKELSKKIEEVRATKNQLLDDHRRMIEVNLKRAEEKRNCHLRHIVHKAHDEEEKAKEIAFINILEAQNKRHDFLTQSQIQEARLADLQEERQRKHQDKAAKEAAAEERRKVMEAERLARIEQRHERRRKQIHLYEEKEKERQEAAREKARDREERLCALQAAHAATVEELQKKIQQKQEESARRHEEKIEDIRRKAFESSVLRCSSTMDDAPRLIPYETKKMCTLCNVLIGSEVYLLSHLKGRKHREAICEHSSGMNPTREQLGVLNLKHIVDAPSDQIDPHIQLDKERQKALRKRCRKLRQRMAARGEEYMKCFASEEEGKGKRLLGHAPNGSKIERLLKEMKKVKENEGRGPWDQASSQALDRALGGLERILTHQNLKDQYVLRMGGGFQLLLELLATLRSSGHKLLIPAKCLSRVAFVWHLGCVDNAENASFTLQSNCISHLIDFAFKQLNEMVPDNASFLPGGGNSGDPGRPWKPDPVASRLLQLLATVFAGLQEARPSAPESHWFKVQDALRYFPFGCLMLDWEKETIERMDPGSFPVSLVKGREETGLDVTGKGL